jgi:hypothetical protein
MEVSGQLQVPAALLPGNKFLVSVGLEAGWAPTLSSGHETRGQPFYSPREINFGENINGEVNGRIVKMLSNFKSKFK